MAKRLVDLARRVLEVVENLGQLEREEFLRVEEREPVGAREPAEFAQRDLPKFGQIVGGVVKSLSESEQWHADGRRGIDVEMRELFERERSGGGGLGGFAARRKQARRQRDGRRGG